MPGNVVLIGFMGAGKSTVGRALAERLHYRFFDTDEMVVTRAGMSVAEIWAAEGEKGFRDREHDAVLHACAGAGRVIACGGGAVLELRNYGLLKGAGTVVYLRAPAGVLRSHVGDGGGRPLLAEEGAFDRLLNARTPAYEAAADLIVDVDASTPDEIAAAIAETLS
ncbi:MAG TPA: shikimate kinase [Actinomycetota bacterium]|nr:shikimate kinase [Actinomycetota bacterium]